MTTITTWLVHCGLIAAVLTVGAHAWEVSARWSGRSARWAWLAALAGSVTLPWLLQLMPERVVMEALGAPVADVAAVPVGAAELEPALLGADAVGRTAAEYAVVLWLVLTLGVLLFIGAMLVAVRREQRRWREAEVEGGRVWVARDMGPAALGVRTGMVVLPAWALQLAGELRSLLLLHEREHVRAGDPRMLLGSLLLLAAMPWNPLVWYQVVRLRNAIELDCDARVLRHGVDPRTYGSLLLEVGRRRGRSALVMATFAEPRIFLEERIRRIARWPLDRRPRRALGFAAVAAVLFAGALSAGDGLRPVELVWADDAAAAPADIPLDPRLIGGVGRLGLGEVKPLTPMPSDTPPAGLESRPTFTPMTVRPELRNRERVSASLLANYPPLLRDAGIGGTPIVWFFLDEDGRVRRVMLDRTSGYPALDEAALKVASEMEFSPALNRDQRVAVWVQIPIVFTPPGGDATQRAAPTGEAVERERQRREQERAAAERAAVPPIEATVVRARDAAVRVLPELRNAVEVTAALSRNYPPLLRDAGIGGTAVVWYYVDEQGRVLRTLLAKPSGYPSLDEAAVHVASLMRFSPHVVDGRPAPAWVALPVSFGGAPVPLLERTDELTPLAPLVVPNTRTGEAVPPSPPPPPAAVPLVTAAREALVLLEQGRLQDFVRAVQRARESGEASVEQVDGLAQQAAVRGFQATQRGAHDEALQFYAAARQLAQTPRTNAMIEFFHGYTLIKQAEPVLRQGNDAEAARRTLPVFAEARRRLEASAAYTEQAATRQQLIRQAEQFIEVAGALASRAPAVPRTDATDVTMEPRRLDVPPAPAPARSTPEDIAARPTFTPMTVRPELQNASEVQRALIRAYPPLLRDAGLGGAPIVWFFIDETGVVRRTQISKTSGYPALDQAALDVAQTMRFSPALNRDRQVAVWVEIPIVFTAR